MAQSLFALQDQNEIMFGYACLIDAILGDTTELNGFACTPTMSPSLTVNVAPGQIYSLQEIDATDFGTAPSLIPADPRTIMKFAYKLDSTPFTFVPPTTPGQSRNDLIQIAFQEVDGDSTAVPFFGGIVETTVLTPTGSTNVPIPQPSVDTNVNVERLDNVVITVVQGTPAATGFQTTPTPTGSATGAIVITTTQGVSTINTGQIAIYPGAPFILEKLKDKAGGPEVQVSAYNYAPDIGTLNNLVVTLTPAVTAYKGGLFVITSPAFTNTAAPSLNVNGVGNVAITRPDGTIPPAGDIISNSMQVFYYDNFTSRWIIMNPANLTYGSITPAQIQFESFTSASSSGSANAYVVALTPAISAYASFLSIAFSPNFTNTAAATLNVNGKGARTILRCDGSAILPGDITAGSVAYVILIGSTFFLLNPNPNLKYAIVGSAHSASGQALTPSTPTKLNFDIVDYDTNSFWNAGATRWQPTRAGYYRFTVNFPSDIAISDSGQLAAFLYVNGTPGFQIAGQNMPSVSAHANATITGSYALHLAGTEFLEIYAEDTVTSSSGAVIGPGGAFQLEYIGA